MQLRTENLKSQANRRSKFTHRSGINPMIQLNQPLFAKSNHITKDNNNNAYPSRTATTTTSRCVCVCFNDGTSLKAIHKSIYHIMYIYNI